MRVSPKKSLGQHFLKDNNIRDKIVDALQATEEDWVVEIGPGTGAMTGMLMARYPHFEAIELDERAISSLMQDFPGIQIHHADVVKFDWASYATRIGHRIHVIGNLPYYVTSQVLFSLIEAQPHISEAILMMQKEVADRLVASPRTKAYGILSVLVQQYAQPQLLFKVSREVFYPKPDVESAVVRLVFQPESEALREVTLRRYKRVVKDAFNQRRKTLRNSLKRLLTDTGGSLPQKWSGARAEELTPADFITLTRHIYGIFDS